MFGVRYAISTGLSFFEPSSSQSVTAAFISATFGTLAINRLGRPQPEFALKLSDAAIPAEGASKNLGRKTQ
jgi:hypothetical protein